MQTLSDMCVLLSSVRQGAAIQKSERARPGRTRFEPGGSADPSISNSVRLELGRDDLQVRSPQGDSNLGHFAATLRGIFKSRGCLRLNHP